MTTERTLSTRRTRRVSGALVAGAVTAALGVSAVAGVGSAASTASGQGAGHGTSTSATSSGQRALAVSQGSSTAPTHATTSGS